jgi:hypothetical protein
VNRRLFRIMLGLAAGLVLILTACGPAPTEGISPISPPSGDAPADTGATVPSGAQEITNAIRQDLSERLNTPADQILVEKAQAVEWPDASLGCPQPGMSYAQVVTPGYQVVLKAGDEQYTYHAGGSNFVLCENGQPAVDPSKSIRDDLSAQEAALVEQAKQDLASRLKAAAETITLQAIQAVRWPDSSLGCPKPGMNYLMVVTPGYLIRLEAGGKAYEYHASKEQVVFCENPLEPLPAQPGGEIDAETRLADLAKGDLAQHLGLSADQIQIITVTAVDWPDASLGCPQPGKMYAQMITPGYQIILAAQGQEYEYHANLADVVLCK